MAISWQEYQEAVGRFYTNLQEIGTVNLNVQIPDKITGQSRQVDVLWELKVGDHLIKILIDAKQRKGKIDVKDLEEVEALANAVNANKAIIVTNNGWTKPAGKKADFSSIDLRLFSVEEALSLVVSNKWLMCQECADECVVMDSDGVLYREDTKLFFVWYAGKCRGCKGHYLFCHECGNRVILKDGEKHKCSCSHIWKIDNAQLYLNLKGSQGFLRVDNLEKPSLELLHWIMGYPKKYWGRISLSAQQAPAEKGNTYWFMIDPDNGRIIEPDYEDEDGPVFFFGLG